MIAVDLYCRAGGASRGLADAGFEVNGIDREPQPEYPYKFEQFDVLEMTHVELNHADLLWASPPCQFRTAYKRRPGHVKESPNLIPKTRELLDKADVHYVIENIPGARDELINPVMLCGSMFGLDVRRHRYFECTFPVKQLKCQHHLQTPRFAPATNRTNLRSTVEVGVWRIPLEVQQKAMGIDWMSLGNLSQAIPPAYSKYLALAWGDLL